MRSMLPTEGVKAIKKAGYTDLKEFWAAANATNPSVEEAAKEPWQMTREEFTESFVKERVQAAKARGEAAFQPIKKGEPGWRMMRESRERTRRRARQFGSLIHRERIERALSEGKPVPPQVLAEYPDLVARYGPGEITLGEEMIEISLLPKDKELWQTTAEENLTTRAIKEGTHPYRPPEGIPATVYPVRAPTGEGYVLFSMTEGVWFGHRSTDYQGAVERADRENRRMWEAYKASHPDVQSPSKNPNTSDVLDDLLPMSPRQGPPLPRGLRLKWPWK